MAFAAGLHRSRGAIWIVALRLCYFCILHRTTPFHRCIRNAISCTLNTDSYVLALLSGRPIILWAAPLSTFIYRYRRRPREISQSTFDEIPNCMSWRTARRRYNQFRPSFRAFLLCTVTQNSGSPSSSVQGDAILESSIWKFSTGADSV